MLAQDALDILTGNWVAKKGGIPPLTDTRPLLMRSVSPSETSERYSGERGLMWMACRCRISWRLP